MPSRLFVWAAILLFSCTASCVPLEETKSDKHNAEYHYILGVTALNEQNPTEALKEFLNAQAFDQEDPKIQGGLAQAYWQKRAFDLAEKHFLSAVELSGQDPDYHNNLGALYLSMERYDDAIVQFRKAADNLLFEHPELAWTAIGLANFQKQDYPAAERAYQKAMEVRPGYFRPAFHLGELYYNLDRPVEALGMFSRAVELAPQFVQGHYWLGLVHMKMKQPGKARQAFAQVVKLAPQSETAKMAHDYLKIINK